MSNLEALLQDTCRRAMAPGQIFDNHLRLYRNPIALAREPRLRFGSSETNAARLAAQPMRPQHPMQREKPAPDAALSAWRRDHKHDHKHDKRRTVHDERLGLKIKAMNKRDREARDAA